MPTLRQGARQGSIYTYPAPRVEERNLFSGRPCCARRYVCVCVRHFHIKYCQLFWLQVTVYNVIGILFLNTRCFQTCINLITPSTNQTSRNTHNFYACRRTQRQSITRDKRATCALANTKLYGGNTHNFYACRRTQRQPITRDKRTTCAPANASEAKPSSKKPQ
jgi:hypothetical protein